MKVDPFFTTILLLVVKGSVYLILPVILIVSMLSSFNAATNSALSVTSFSPLFACTAMSFAFFSSAFCAAASACFCSSASCAVSFFCVFSDSGASSFFVSSSGVSSSDFSSVTFSSFGVSSSAPETESSFVVFSFAESSFAVSSFAVSPTGVSTFASLLPASLASFAESSCCDTSALTATLPSSAPNTVAGIVDEAMQSVSNTLNTCFFIVLPPV